MAGKSLLILNGPGLGSLPDLGGQAGEGLSAARIEEACGKLCERYGLAMTFLTGWVASEGLRHRDVDISTFDALIVNPIECAPEEGDAGSAEPRSAVDMLARLNKPIIEVHLSNIFQPGDGAVDPCHTRDAKIGLVSGLGLDGYLLAIQSIAARAGLAEGGK